MAASVRFGILLSTVLFASSGEAAEFLFQPNVTVSEEYTDNVLLEPADPQYDLITRIAPAFLSTYRAPLWDLDAAYTYDYRYYAKTLIRTERTHIAHAASQVRMVPEFLFLDVRDDYRRVSLDLIRDFTQESSFMNQTDRNVFSASPYIKTGLTSQLTVSTGYVYRNTWYKDPLSIDTIEHTGFADFQQEALPRLSVLSGVRYTENENDVLPFIREDAYLGLVYEYTDGSTVSATGGYSHFEFNNKDQFGQAFWDARLTHKLPTITTMLEVGMVYLADPIQVLRREDRFLAIVQKKTDRTLLEAAGEVREYRDATTNHLEFTLYRVRGTAAYAFTQKTTITGRQTLERMKDDVLRAYTNRSVTDIRFENALLEDLTWALEYVYSNMYSPDIYLNNYTNNRILVELKKTF